MLPGSSGQDLLYVALGNANVFVYTYPDVELVGRLSGVVGALCSDRSGDVFVVEEHSVLEFAHGGTTPINTLNVGGRACSWDPTTGNLAVLQQSSASFTIFPHVTGAPETYAYTGNEFVDCAYDNRGNLFFDRSVRSHSNTLLTEFLTKTATFKTITLNEQLSGNGLQWDGKYLAMDYFPGFGMTVNRIQVSGSRGTVESTVFLRGYARSYGYPSWIQDGTIIAALFIKRPSTRGHSDGMDFWAYPKGGQPEKKLLPRVFKGKGPIWGITVSVAPSTER
jgi:hypothetical protein